jgi:hypothetical protein
MDTTAAAQAVITELESIKAGINNLDDPTEARRLYNQGKSLMIIHSFKEGLNVRNQDRVLVQEAGEEYCPWVNQQSGTVSCDPCDSFHDGFSCKTPHEIHGPIDLPDLPTGNDILDILGDKKAIYIGTSQVKFLPQQRSEWLNLSIPEDVDYGRNPGQFIVNRVRERMLKLGDNKRNLPIFLDLDVDEMDITTTHYIIGKLLDLKETYKREIVILIGMVGTSIRQVSDFPNIPDQTQDQNKSVAAFDIGTISGVPTWPLYLYPTKVNKYKLNNGKCWYKHSRQWRYEPIFGRNGKKTREFYSRLNIELQKVLCYTNKADLYYQG